MYVYSWFGTFSAESTPTRIPMTIATSEPADEPRAGDPDGQQDGGDGHRQEQQDAVDHAPAHRPEDPFADPERDADDEQEDREDDEDEGQRAEGDDPADLAGDRGRLGLGEVDVGDDEGHRRVAGRAELGAKARRWHLGPRLDGGGGGGGGVRGGGSVGDLVVQGCAPAPGSDAGVSGDDSSASRSASRRQRAAVRCRTCPMRSRADLLTAELLSIGSELTVGETRDTNAGELARSLTGLGVRVDPADGAAGRPRRGHRCVRRGARAVPTSSSRPAASVRPRTT